jgi:hypothetical protein
MLSYRDSNPCKEGQSMCDYSLQAVKSRPAQVGEKLVTHNFGTGSRGFCPADEHEKPGATAVCVMPGTEIAFDEPVVMTRGIFTGRVSKANVAIFRQINKDEKHCHHDALELVDGEVILLSVLPEGQTATVLQLPAAPKTEKEAEDQKRVEYAG